MTPRRRVADLAAAVRPRRALVVAAAILLVPVASTGMAGPLEEQLKDTRKQQQEIKGEIRALNAREQHMLEVVESYNQRINRVQQPILDLTKEIDDLDLRAQHRRDRIVELRRLYKQQQRDIVRLSLELDVAQDRLAARMVEAYKRGDGSEAAWLVGAHSLSDAFNRREALSRIVGLDQQVVDTIDETQRKIRVKRARNHSVQRRIRQDIAGIERDLAEAGSRRAQLEQRRAELEAVKAERDAALDQLRAKEDHLEDQYDQLHENEQAIKDAIASGAQVWGGSVPAGPSPGGLAWPVSGPIVSPFGPRWGRMHEGVDIAVPAGVPIHAAAGGVVTYSGWMSGYGNMVIVQHAGSLSTGYAHQSRIVVANGQFVAQGALIGYIGCTGHCFGDHLHFETRINGSAVDPMRYL